MENQKTWFVTGASKGLGLSLITKLLELGNKVAATSRNIKGFEELKHKHGDRFLPLIVDLASDDSVSKAVKHAAETFDGIDVAINNAGYSIVGSMEEISDQEFRESIDVNLFGTVNVIRAVMPIFRNRNAGHFINISSNAGYVGFANAASYNAAKFAVIGISEALAEEVKQFGIKVTVVAPGQFRTSFMDSLKYAENKIPVYKLAEAEENWKQYSGKQQGDPDKLVDILIGLPAQDKPPLHLLAGPDTWNLVHDQRAKEAAEFEQWKSVTLSTDFD